MFVLKLDENKSLSLTKSTVNYKSENNAEYILILLPQILNGYNLRNCAIRLDMLNQDNVGSMVDIIPDDELYKSFLKCAIPITKEWTYKDGKITLWLTIIHAPNEADIGTNEVCMPIKDRKVIENFIPTQAQGTLDQLVIDVSNKADGLLYENNTLRLTSKGRSIGNSITITGSGGTIGSNGKSIEYTWDGTSLGIRQEYEDAYEFVNLKGEKGETGAKGDKGLKGDAFVYADFTPEQLTSLKGLKGDKGDSGLKGDNGDKGDKGDTFVYSDFTTEQLNALKGDKGDKGDKGESFKYSDFTLEQLATLKGDRGDKGDSGLKGDKGADGQTPVKGTDYFTPAEIETIKVDIETDLTSITTVNAVSDVYSINFNNKPSINITITTTDTVAKTVAVTNVPTRTEMYLELVYTNAAAITWFSGIVWQSGSAPTLAAGKTYRMAFFTSDGGITWHGYCAGGV